MAEAVPVWSIEELRSDHERSEFACGQPSLDEFLRKYAGQNQKSGISRTFVATRPGEKTIRGYYSLAAGAVAFIHLPEELRKRLPRYPIPTAHLGRLAVDASSQRQRLGEFMLLDAFRRIDAAADSVGIHAVEVVAIDDVARRFYLKYGFVELLDDRHHLYLPMTTIRSLRLS